MKRHTIVAVLSSAVLVALAGCSTTSSNPSSAASSAVIEQRDLAGTWRGEFYQVGADRCSKGR